MRAPRPVLYVLAGVNGAGKSSVGGYLIQRAGLDWFNPDAYAQELQRILSCDIETANIWAWQEGVQRLDGAIAHGVSHAFETTLGGRTILARLQAAARTHDVLIWFCGLASPDLHIARVRARVRAGGHDIPEDKIRARWRSSIGNLIALLPYTTRVQVYDNSATILSGASIPDPLLLAQAEHGQLVYPHEVAQLAATPDWAKPILEAMLTSGDGTSLARPAMPSNPGVH